MSGECRETIEFGIWADTLAKQFKRLRVKADTKDVEHWQLDANALLRLKFRKVITHRAYVSGIARLTKAMLPKLTCPKRRNPPPDAPRA